MAVTLFTNKDRVFELLITGSYDKTLRIWNVEKKHNIQCIGKLEEHVSSVYSVDISKDNKWIASGGRDNCLIIWNFEKILILIEENFFIEKKELKLSFE